MQLKDFLPRISRMQRIISNDREKRNVIARRSRSNPIFALVKKFLLIFTFNFLLLPFAFSQQTYNLEIIFKRTNWNPDTIRSYGNALSSAGDVNQDGFEDIAYSVFFDNWYGYGYVFFGGNPMDTFPDLILKCEGEGQPLMSICSGDLNGDSISDVIIGEGQAGNWGKVFIFFGSSGMDSLPDMILNGEPLNAWPFGISVACGDVNGDTFDDLIVGSYDNGDLNGRVYVYYGGPLLDTIPDVLINGHNSESMGITVGSGGDVNSDGFEDIVAGAFNNDEAGFWAGKVYVFLGGNPMDTIPDCWLHGEEAGHSLGWYNVSFSNNISDFDRTVTGTWHYQEPGRSGKIYVLYGGSPMDTLPDVWMLGYTDSSGLGAWSASVCHINSDNYGEILGDAPGDPPESYGFGVGYVWLGAFGMDTTSDAWLKGRYFADHVGDRIASAGDVNGDGFDEVMFSNYAGVNPTVWVCRYAPGGIQDTRYTMQDKRIELYPNPFLDKINIKYTIENSQFMIKKFSLKIYDISGRIVKDLSKNLESCILNHVSEIVWKGDDDLGCKVPAGVYFVQVGIGEERMIKKVIKIK